VQLGSNDEDDEDEDDENDDDEDKGLAGGEGRMRFVLL
jgi:hypothetical protein